MVTLRTMDFTKHVIQLGCGCNKKTFTELEQVTFEINLIPNHIIQDVRVLFLKRTAIIVHHNGESVDQVCRN